MVGENIILMMIAKIIEWTDEDILLFATIATQGAYGDYRGCKTLISKLNKYKKLKTMVNQKSIDSFNELIADGSISIRQQQVLKCLKEELGMATNKMIAKKLGWDINRVTGRITELREKKLVGFASDYYDIETNRTVNMWKCL